MSKTDELSWMHVIVRVGLNACTHPIEYAKVLIQIGHEPLPPYKSRTIFGREKLFYPSIFSYIRFIKQRDGFGGCYRGLAPKLCANICSGLVFPRITDAIPMPPEVEDKDSLSVEERTQRFIYLTSRETVGRVAAIIASQPLHVIAVRTMAEFVGEDGQYTSIYSSVLVIYREEGIKGFFAGLIPRILCDVGSLWLSNTIIHVLNNYVIEDSDVKTYVTASVRFLASALLYPFQVVSNCVAVSGSGLVAGSPPMMPIYKSWRDCYNHLASIGCLKRGSTLLWRTYSGPAVLSSAGELTVPSTKLFTKKH